MRIAVCVKQVPSSAGERMLRSADSRLDRSSEDQVLNELDEYAVEEALRIAEAHGGEVTAVTMGPAQAETAVRRALQMGAEAGVHLVDDGLAGSDALATSYALAELLKGRGFDLVIFGSESTDARMSVVPAMVAERLGYAQLTFAQQVEVSGSTVTVQRVTDTGFDTVTGQTPAVVSVVEKINEPRYPSFKGIMAAKKKPVETVTVAEAGLDPSRVGLGASWSSVVDFAARPPKQPGVIISDEGDGGVKLAEFLADRKFI